MAFRRLVVFAFAFVFAAFMVFAAFEDFAARQRPGADLLLHLLYG
jgi:hypothetical protein